MLRNKRDPRFVSYRNVQLRILTIWRKTATCSTYGEPLKTRKNVFRQELPAFVGAELTTAEKKKNKNNRDKKNGANAAISLILPFQIIKNGDPPDHPRDLRPPQVVRIHQQTTTLIRIRKQQVPRGCSDAEIETDGQQGRIHHQTPSSVRSGSHQTNHGDSDAWRDSQFQNMHVEINIKLGPITQTSPSQLRRQFFFFIDKITHAEPIIN